jgi:hypothetical protein
MILDGIFRLKTNVITLLYNANGKLIDKQDGYNTITLGDPNPGITHNGLVLLLARFFNNSDIYDPDDFVNKMQLGSTSSADDSGLTSPIISTPDVPPKNTMIPFTTDAFNETNPPGPDEWYTSPIYSMSCSWGPANGFIAPIIAIGSVGLFADGTDTTMISYKTFNIVEKETNGTFTINWDFQVVYTAP